MISGLSVVLQGKSMQKADEAALFSRNFTPREKTQTSNFLLEDNNEENDYRR